MYGRWRRRQRRWLTYPFGLALLCAVLVGCGGEQLVGTDLGMTAAPDFTLRDHRGSLIRLSEQAGRAVVLTFIYTSCPDVCPLTANTIAAAYDQLSDAERARVSLLAVTVDPLRDTPAALAAFSAQHGLESTPAWHALTGSESELSAVWSAYHVDTGAMLRREAWHAGESEANAGMPHVAAPGALMSHSDAIYVIDPAGRQRVLLHSDVDPTDLAHDLRALLP